VLCIAVGAGAAGAINMWYDRDIDAVMRAPAPDPCRRGKMEPRRGAGLRRGAVGLFSVMMMGWR
jgi:heme o synthase